MYSFNLKNYEKRRQDGIFVLKKDGNHQTGILHIIKMSVPRLVKLDWYITYNKNVKAVAYRFMIPPEIYKILICFPMVF